MSPKKGHRLTCDGIEYKLLTPLGGGGSGDVWLAEAGAKQWAVKLLRSGADRKKIERFDREASFQAGCAHEHIVPVIGRGKHGDRFFYIMPCYPDTLRDVIARRDVDFRTLLSYIRQIGDALQFAHERGIAHRDIKPENVLVDGALAVLADFGIAHFVDSTLTSAGELVGNRDYRAPEQRRGQDARDVGPEADVYALGLIVNECFTREIPAGPSYRSIETAFPLLSYLDTTVARMLAQIPRNRPTIADVLTDIRFFEAKRNDEIDDIEEALRLADGAPSSGAEQFDALFRQASEDIWYASSLIASKTPDELKQYNGNWHMRLGYDADAFLRNLCIQSRLFDLCERKFNYESHVYKGDRHYSPLDLDGKSNHRDLYSQAQALVSAHPLPRAYDLSGRILKTFASCAEYHCTEILSDARRITSDVDRNLVDAPILWIVGYLASNVPTVADVGPFADHVHINWGRSEAFVENDDDANLFVRAHPALDPEPVLDALKEAWDVSVRRTNDGWCSVMFRTPGEYVRFREHAFKLAAPHYVYEGDVKDLFRDAVCADGITQLTLGSGFDVCNTLAKVLGLRDIV
ncbi:serine/threonine-protein kinase [Nocardioides ungokensis]|uniref:serine/threonine-protein kinase n=1 Tax=Nocardioides ungokensis TaxID=1643322 RepID=UPI0015DE2580|nr:serine/threonine-protein kinase [Nocardioides ungokensis]